MSARILGLDPGETTGYALLEAEKTGIRALTYGVIPRLRPGASGLVYSVREWLEWAAPTFDLRGSDCDIVFEELILSYQSKTRKESLEARGVIREWCATNKPVDSFAYSPSQVRQQLGLPLKGSVKKDMAMWVERALGYRPCGPDHITDACGVALCHALKIGVWRAHITLPQKQAKGLSVAVKTTDGCVETSVRPQAESRMTAAEFREAIARGELVHTGHGMQFVTGRAK